MHVDEGVFLERERQRGASALKRRYFAAIGFYKVKTVAGRPKYRLAALVTGFLDLSTSITLNNFELPKRGFVEFFAIFWLQRTLQQ